MSFEFSPDKNHKLKSKPTNGLNELLAKKSNLLFSALVILVSLAAGVMPLLSSFQTDESDEYPDPQIAQAYDVNLPEPVIFEDQRSALEIKEDFDKQLIEQNNKPKTKREQNSLIVKDSESVSGFQEIPPYEPGEYTFTAQEELSPEQLEEIKIKSGASDLQIERLETKQIMYKISSQYLASSYTTSWEQNRDTADPEDIMPGQNADITPTNTNFVNKFEESTGLSLTPNIVFTTQEALTYTTDPGLVNQWYMYTADHNFHFERKGNGYKSTATNPINQIGHREVYSKEGFECSEQVKIAILDTGVDLDNEDLAPSIKQNYTTIDIYPDGNDFHSHGTHVAGTAAAITDNGIGIAGVCSGAEIIPIKVLNNNGSGSYTEILQGMQLAVDLGADVANMSLGGRLPVNPETGEIEPDYKGYYDAMNQVIAEANSKGTTFVVAAGNDRLDLDTYNHLKVPSELEGLISVGATDSNGQIASFSNYGKNTVEVMAPGVNIYSSIPDNRYKSYQGTSMASPVVAGVVGLIKSNTTDLSFDQILSIVQSNTSRYEDYKDIAASGIIDLVSVRAAIQNPEANLIAYDDYNYTVEGRNLSFNILGNDLIKLEQDEYEVTFEGIPEELEYSYDSGVMSFESFFLDQDLEIGYTLKNLNNPEEISSATIYISTTSLELLGSAPVAENLVVETYTDKTEINLKNYISDVEDDVNPESIFLEELPKNSQASIRYSDKPYTLSYICYSCNSSEDNYDLFAYSIKDKMGNTSNIGYVTIIQKNPAKHNLPYFQENDFNGSFNRNVSQDSVTIIDPLAYIHNPYNEDFELAITYEYKLRAELIKDNNRTKIKVFSPNLDVLRGYVGYRIDKRLPDGGSEFFAEDFIFFYNLDYQNKGVEKVYDYRLLTNYQKAVNYGDELRISYGHIFDHWHNRKNNYPFRYPKLQNLEVIEQPKLGFVNSDARVCNNYSVCDPYTYTYTGQEPVGGEVITDSFKVRFNDSKYNDNNEIELQINILDKNTKYISPVSPNKKFFVPTKEKIMIDVRSLFESDTEVDLDSVSVQYTSNEFYGDYYGLGWSNEEDYGYIGIGSYKNSKETLYGSLTVTAMDKKGTYTTAIVDLETVYVNQPPVSTRLGKGEIVNDRSTVLIDVLADAFDEDGDKIDISRAEVRCGGKVEIVFDEELQRDVIKFTHIIDYDNEEDCRASSRYSTYINYSIIDREGSGVEKDVWLRVRYNRPPTILDSQHNIYNYDKNPEKSAIIDLTKYILDDRDIWNHSLHKKYQENGINTGINWETLEINSDNPGLKFEILEETKLKVWVEDESLTSANLSLQIRDKFGIDGQGELSNLGNFQVNYIAFPNNIRPRDFAGVDIQADQDKLTVTKTAPQGWSNAGLESENILEKDKNGLISFEVESTDKSYMVGFNNFQDEVNHHYAKIDHAAFVNKDKLVIYENKNLVYHSAKDNILLKPGDKISIIKSDSLTDQNYVFHKFEGNIHYLINDQKVYTNKQKDLNKLRLDSSLLTNGAIIKDLKIDFSGDAVLPSFQETFEARDYDGVEVSYNDEYNLDIIKTRETEAWNAGYESRMINYRNFNSEINFDIDNIEDKYMVGFNNQLETINHHFNEIDFAVYKNANLLQVYENGRRVYDSETDEVYLSQNDRVSIRKVDNYVYYLINDSIVYKSTPKVNTNLRIDLSLLTPGAKVTNLEIKYADYNGDVKLPGDHTDNYGKFELRDNRGVEITVNEDQTLNIQKNTTESWINSGVESSLIADTDQNVKLSFQTQGNEQKFMIGLSRYEDIISHHFKNISYALYLDNNVIRIFEDGKGQHQSLVDNIELDQDNNLSIERVGGKVVYKLNGQIIYVSRKTSSGPLVLDTSFRSENSSIKNLDYTYEFDTSEYQSNIPWRHLRGLEIENNPDGQSINLSKVYADGWNSKFVSEELLDEDQKLEVSFVVDNIEDNYQVGLTKEDGFNNVDTIDIKNNPNYTDVAIHKIGSRFIIKERGESDEVDTPAKVVYNSDIDGIALKEGDRLSILRLFDPYHDYLQRVYYTLNGKVVYSRTGAGFFHDSYHLDVSVNSANSVIKDLKVDNSDQLALPADYVTQINEDFELSFYNGLEVDLKEDGSFDVTKNVRRDGWNTLIEGYELPYGFSANYNKEFEFTVDNLEDKYMLGYRYVTIDSVHNPNQLSHGIFKTENKLRVNQNLYETADSKAKTVYNADIDNIELQIGDVIGVKNINGVHYYTLNNKLIYVSRVDYTIYKTLLKFNTRFVGHVFSEGAKIKNLKVNHSGNVELPVDYVNQVGKVFFNHKEGLEIQANLDDTFNVTKSIRRDGWNTNLDTKTRIIKVKGGRLDFEVNNLDDIYLIGFNNPAEVFERDPNGIDYAIVKNGNKLRIKENGKVAYNGDRNGIEIKVGDKLSIKKEANQISYLLNEEVFYTSQIVVETDLMFDLAVFSSGSKIENIKFQTN